MISEIKNVQSDNRVGVKRILLLFLILLVFPLGLFLMWKWKLWNYYLKIVISLLILFFIRQIVVLYMIFYGFFLFPEASSILSHYCFSDGSDLVLSNNYLKRSPVILNHIRNMKIGEKRKVGMHQLEDMRLSFALNPFTIEKNKENVAINQYIKFDSSGKVTTWIGPIPVPDNIVHSFDCKPFLVKTEIAYKEIVYKDVDAPNFIENYFINNHKKCGKCSVSNFRKL